MTNPPTPVFLRGKKTLLRPILKSDIPFLLRWVNDPDVREFLASYLPKMEDDEEAWLKKLTNSTTEIVLVITTLDGTPIGTMGLHRIEWKDRVATTGALIGEREYWGKGYGTDAKMALLAYAFDELGLHKICSAVSTYNKRSLAYSLHCGYRIEGRRAKHIFKRGRHWDLIELGLFRKWWKPIAQRYARTGSVK